MSDHTDTPYNVILGVQPLLDRIVALEAEKEVRDQWVYDFVDGMARSAGLLIQWRCEQAEAEVERLNKENLEWQDKSLKNLIKAGEAKAEVERLRTALVAIQATTPGSAHRIAIQTLGKEDE